MKRNHSLLHFTAEWKKSLLIAFLHCRSLIAAYLLVLNGYKNVYHLEGGLYKWFKEELPEVSEE